MNEIDEYFIRLVEEILHQLIWLISHYLQGFIHPRWLFGISEPSTVCSVIFRRSVVSGNESPPYFVSPFFWRVGILLRDMAPRK